MADAGANEHARVDALVACSQRNVWVATWEPASSSIRTLEHDDGHTALPVFSDEWELDRAADTLEWNRGSFRVARREIPARDAMRQVMNDQLSYLVIDVASEHCVEATRAEIEPLAEERASSQGPFAAVGRITSTMIEAVRTSHAPTGIAILGGRESSHPPSAIALPPGSRISPEPPAPPQRERERSEPTMPAVLPPKHRVSSSPTIPALMVGPIDEPRAAIAPDDANTPAYDTGVAISAMTGEPPDAWLDAYASALKQFPEVEWACFCLASFGGATPVPMIAVRVDPSFRQRVAEIGLAVGEVSGALQVRVGTLLVNEPAVLKDARAEGIPFLPWRRRRSSPFTPSV